MTSNTCSSPAALIRDALAPVSVLVRDLEPLDVPLPDAVELLDAFVELRRIAEAGVVVMTARAVEAGEWKDTRSPSPADWLAMRQGTSVGRAGGELATSKRLGGLPTTSRNLRSGAVSAEQAGLVAGAAEVNPAAERDLLSVARTDSLKHLREEAARRRAEMESELSKTEREQKAHAERSVKYGTSKNRWWMRVSGPIPAGAAVEKEIENRVGDLMRTRNAAGHDREGREQIAYDAVMECLTENPAPAAADNGTVAPKARRKRVDRLMLVRVDLAALIRGSTEPGEVCEIGGEAISVDAARRMFGDSVVALITTNGLAVIDVVNLSRKPSVAQQIAKLWTDPKCVVEGCNRTVRIEIDHRIDWHLSHRTVANDTERMCKHDHDLKTHHNYQLVPGTGRRELVPPGHPLHPDTLNANTANQTDEAHATEPPLEDTG